MRHILNYIPRNLLFLRLPMFVAVLLSAAHPALCDEAPIPEESQMTDDVAADDTEALHHAAVYAGYRFVSPVDNPAAAAPYLKLKSGVGGGFYAGTFGTDMKLLVDSRFLHADDYNAGLSLDYSGLYRLRIESSSLWHNLEQAPPATAAFVTSRELDSGVSYGTRTVISRVENRIKLGNNPIHLNLNYWQLTREGTAQLRFSDYGFDVKPNSAVTRSIPVDSVTREGTIGLDAHVGPVNAAYNLTIRDFSNLAPDSRYQFTARDTLAHNVINNSRLVSHTFKLFSDLSGGLTTSAQYTISQRETATDRSDARPSSAPADTIQTTAGEISYTPFKELTLNARYRRLQIDRESPETIYAPLLQLTPAVTTLQVRPSSSSAKDTLILSASYRPTLKTVYRFEYRAELESRDDLPDHQTVFSASKSDSRQTHTGKATFIWKPVDGIKLHTSYSYAASDNPAYSSSFAERHNGQALISFTSKGLWGATTNYQGRFESGGSSYQQTNLPRETLSNSVNASIWFSPMERITLNAGYSYQKSRIDQTNVFFNSFAVYNNVAMTTPIRTAGSYSSAAHIYSLDAVVALTRMLDLSLAFQQTFSDVKFLASDNSTIAVLSSSGIGDQTRLVSTATGLTSRADLRLSNHLGCSLGYSFRILNTGQPDLDGSAHETLLALTGRW